MLLPCAFGLTAVALLIQWVPSLATGTTAAPAATSTHPPPPPPPTVNCANGPIAGLTIPLAVINPALPGAADWFFGIPYAQPPVGDLRMEKPVAVNNWNGTFQANNPYSALPCYNQHSPNPALGIGWTEDCLKLNVYRPAGTQPNAGLPVLVYIHTGGWGVGGLLVEGPYGFNAIYVSQGIIVVHIAYRLTLLGFFSDGSSALPGNLGLWDQRMALQWVNKNAKAFGGDPNRITVWGESAGAASVAFHSVTPGSYNLFAQAIQQSGSWNSPWAVSTKTVTSSIAAAKALKCPRGPGLKQCLKDLSIADIQAELDTHPYGAPDFNFVLYTPRVDGQFFGADFQTLAQKAPKKPTLIGFNSDESIILTTAFPAAAFDVTSKWTVANAASFTKQNLIDFINNEVDAKMPLLSNCKEMNNVRSELIRFYASVNNTANSPTFYFQQYTRLLTDIQFIIPVLWEARLKSQLNWPTYLYHFDHINSVLGASIPYKAVQHTGEYPYVIGVNLFGAFNFTANDLAVQQAMVAGYVSFIKTGNPSVGSPTAWPRLNFTGLACNGSSKYTAMNLNPSPFVESASANGVSSRLGFWDALAKTSNLGLVYSFPNVQLQCTGGLLGTILNNLLNGLARSRSSSGSSSHGGSWEWGK